MKEIKFLVAALVGVVYASFWWLPFVVNIRFIILPFLATVVLIIPSIFYCKEHWND